MTSSRNSYWLLKTEPETYSFARLRKEGRTNWDQVRNFQARNNLRLIARDDVALIYHSGDERAVVGLAQVVREAYPDPDPETPGDWVQIDIEPIRDLERAVNLSELKANPVLATLPLIKQSRLSVMPISVEHYEAILALARRAAPTAPPKAAPAKTARTKTPQTQAARTKASPSKAARAKVARHAKVPAAQSAPSARARKVRK